jgi:hypothetical protein
MVTEEVRRGENGCTQVRRHDTLAELCFNKAWMESAKEQWLHRTIPAESHKDCMQAQAPKDYQAIIY